MRYLLDKIRRDPTPAQRLYAEAVDAARQGRWYDHFDVPDTVDGRFDMLALHLFLLHERMAGEPGGEPLMKQVVELFVADMDQNLRELGVGDPSMGRQVRATVEALHGRFVAYGEALGSADPAALRLALARNVYRDPDRADATVDALADHVRATAARLAAVPAAAVLAGGVALAG